MPGKPIDINAVIAEHWDALHRAATHQATRRGLNATDAEEIAANAIAHAGTEAVEKFDPARGNLRSFLLRCVQRHAHWGTCHVYRKRALKGAPALSAVLDQVAPARNDSHGVDRLVEDILAHPETYLNPREVRVMLAVIHRDDETELNLAKRLGHPSVLRLTAEVEAIQRKLIAALDDR